MKIKIIILFIFLLATALYSQEDRKPPRADHQPPSFKERHKKFEQLEQLKLLEFLDLDEEAAVKFITRRNKSRDRIFLIMKNLDKVYDDIQTLVNNDQKEKNYRALIDKSLDLENEMVEERKSFLNSLKDILTEEQIAKVILFERKFKRDIRDILIERGKKRALEK